VYDYSSWDIRDNMAFEWLTWELWIGFLLVTLVLFLFIVFLQLRRVQDTIPSDVLEAADLHESDLTRDMNTRDVTLLGVGAMIGAGIFVLTGDAAGVAGPGLMAVFLFNGFATGMTALVYAELGSAVPEAGGGYLWVKSAFGQYQAFLGGWMSWLAHIVAGSLYGIGFGSYFAYLLETMGILPENAHKISFFSYTATIGNVDIIDAKFGYTQMFAVIIIFLFLIINFLGSSETGTVGNVITITKVIIISVFILSGLWFAVRTGLAHNFSKLEPIFPPNLVNEVGQQFPPFLQNSFLPIFIAMGFTFISFEGYEIIVQTGEEAEDPNLTVPRSIFYSLIIVVPIYFFVGLTALVTINNSATGMATWRILGDLGEVGIAEIAQGFMPLGSALMLFGGLVSTLSALNATIYSSARVAFVMGRDKLLPSQFLEVNAWRRTPHYAIAVSGMIMIAVALFLPLQEVAAMADLLFVLLFLQVDLSILRIRPKYNEKLFYGYQLPFYPWIVYIAIAAQIGLGFALTLHFNQAPIGAGIWLIIGTIVYFGYIRGNIASDQTMDAFEPYIRKKYKQKAKEQSSMTENQTQHEEDDA